MASVVDLWRAIDPDAALVAGAVEDLGRPVRAVERTRAVAPHLPRAVDGSALIVDAGLIGSLDELTDILEQAELAPIAIVVSGSPGSRRDSADSAHATHATCPLLLSQLPPSALADRAGAYLADPAGWLARSLTELRLLCAEAALGDPRVSTPAGLVAARIRRGVAVVADGELSVLHPRPAGRALAARFAATHARLLTASGHRGGTSRRTRDGLWLLERQVRPGASVWLFDDLPFAAVDEVAAEAVAVTLRALLRRPAADRAPRRAPAAPATPAAPGEHGEAAPVDTTLMATMLAVARHNGRVAPAARELGVHRNTVLYRLRRGQAEHGLDPRRPGDALRLLSGSPPA